MMEYRNKILCGDVLTLLKQLPDESVDCCITSPPYWGLRDYGTNGQIGLEPTIEEYIEKITLVFKEVKRVLKAEGTLWLNMGDCYAGSMMGRDSEGNAYAGAKQSTNKGSVFDFGRQGETSQVSKVNRGRATGSHGLKPKDLVGMPWRVAFALQTDGWYLRSDIIWSKPNPMPESVTDRPTKAHEYVFLLSKSAKYFYDADAVKEAQCQSTIEHAPRKKRTLKGEDEYGQKPTFGSQNEIPGGRNKRTVWEIATQSFPDAHFATFPEKLVEPCILAGTSEKGYCFTCGKPWRRNIENKPMEIKKSHRTYSKGRTRTSGTMIKPAESKTLGWLPSCDCFTSYIAPGLVLDPFMGSGTVALVAHRLDRDFIGFELSAEYCEIANKRIKAEVMQERLFVEG